MAVQVIGLQAKFDVNQFQGGLSIYLRGLEKATQATKTAATAMSNLGMAFGTTLPQAAQSLSSITPQISKMAKSFQTVSTASKQTGQSISANQARINAMQGEMRDVIRIAQARAIQESAVTSAYQKQLALIEQQAAKESRLNRFRDLKSQGLNVNQTLGGVRGIKIDPLKDFNAATIKALGDEFGKVEQKVSVFRRALNSLTGAGRSAESSMNRITTGAIALGVALGQTAFLAAQRLIGGFTRLASQGIELSAFFERLGLSINFFAARTAQQEDASLTFNQALAATQREAQGVLLWVKQLAVASPFTAKQVGVVFRVSQAYGLLAEEARAVLPLLLDVGAATGLDAQTLENAARALGQIRSRGKLTGEEIRQLGNAGIPIRDILVKQLQITNKEFDTLLESGALVSDLVIPAIVDSLQEFEGASEKVAFETIGGLISAFEDIKEIGIAEFFSGLLKPIAPLLKQLVETLNSPEFRAILQIVGEDLGVVFTGAINSLTSAIGGLVKAWQSLTPETRRNIILFSSVFAGVIALVGVFSLLFFAITTLINPLTITAALFAGLVVAWVNGWDSIRTAAITAANAVLDGLIALAQGITKALDFLFAPLEAFAAWAEGNESDARDAGRKTGEQYGVGLAEGGVIGVTNAVVDIANAISGELEPKSPPKALPLIGYWGEVVGGIFGSAIGDGAEKAILDSAVQQRSAMALLTKQTADGALAAYKKEEVRFTNAGKQAGGVFFDGWSIEQGTFSQKAPGVIDEANVPVEEAAYAAGLRVGDAYTRGFGLLFRKPGEIIDPAIAELVKAIGDGRQLTRAGAESFDRFLEGFKEADFGALDEAGGIVQSFVKNLVTLGDVRDIDLPRQLFKVREALASSLQEMRKFGSISQESFNRVRQTAEPLGSEIVELLDKYQLLAQETENVRISQEELNAVTEKYDNLLNPLKDQLKEVSNERQTAQEVRQIAGLQRLLNNSLITEERKRIARAQITEILTRQQIRNLEVQKDKEEGIAEATLETSKEKEDAAKSELDVYKQRLGAQIDQLGLVADEAKIIENLQKQLDKKQEKELSILDRQLKFAGLQKAELADTLAAAKARFVLEDASSSEQEKAAANLTLQTVALNRLNREGEATKLGFNAEDLKPLRELAITLDDIGKKGKGGAELAGTGLDASLLEDPLKRLGEWENITDRVKGKWDEWLGVIRANLIWINDRLPGFLKLFPESSSPEEVPIIDSIYQIAGGVLAVGAAWKLVDFGYKLVFLLDKLKILAGLAVVGGKLWAVIQWIGAFATGMGVVAAGWITLGLVVAAFAAALVLNLGGARDVMSAFVRSFKQDVESATVFIDAAAETAQLKLRSLFDPTTSVGDISYQEIYAKKLAEVNARHLAEGNPFNAPEFRESFLISGTEGGREFLERVDGSIGENSNLVLEAAKGLGIQGAEGFQTGMNDGFSAWPGATQFLADTFGVTTESLIGVKQGGIDLGQSFGDGIPEGLKASAEADARLISTEVVDVWNNSLKEAAGAQSPSKLTFDEVGVPMGEGIREGLLSVSTQGATRDLIDGTVDQFNSLKTRAGNKFQQLNTLLLTKNKELQTKLTILTQETNDGMLEQFTVFVGDVSYQFEVLFGTILEGWNTVGTESVTSVTTSTDAIVGIFQGLGTAIFTGELGLNALASNIAGIWGGIREAQSEGLLGVRDDIVGVWVTDDDSVIKQLQNALFGSPTSTGGAQQISPVWSLGKGMMSGIAQGVTDNAYLVKNSLKEALLQSLIGAQTSIQSNSPSLVAAEMLGKPISEGVTLGVMEGAGNVISAVNGVVTGAIANASAPLTGTSSNFSTPTFVSNISRTQQYNLNVNSSAGTQGIIEDFGIMQTLAAI